MSICVLFSSTIDRRGRYATKALAFVCDDNDDNDDDDDNDDNDYDDDDDDDDDGILS